MPVAMTTAVSRMQFLRGDFSGRTSPIRPPWAADEFLFTSVCDSCGECVTHCPVQIIEKGRGNFPVVNFSSGECDFCGVCVEHCAPGALKKLDGKRPWAIAASIEAGKCIAYNGVECRSCEDPCETRAISMVPRIGGVSIPILNTKQCTGCGACFSVCPVQAINMKQNTQESL